MLSACHFAPADFPKKWGHFPPWARLTEHLSSLADTAGGLLMPSCSESTAPRLGLHGVRTCPGCSVYSSAMVSPSAPSPSIPPLVEVTSSVVRSHVLHSLTWFLPSCSPVFLSLVCPVHTAVRGEDLIGIGVHFCARMLHRWHITASPVGGPVRLARLQGSYSGPVGSGGGSLILPVFTPHQPSSWLTMQCDHYPVY